MYICIDLKRPTEGSAEYVSDCAIVVAILLPRHRASRGHQIFIRFDFCVCGCDVSFAPLRVRAYRSYVFIYVQTNE